MSNVELPIRTASEWPHWFVFCSYWFFIGGQLAFFLMK